MAGKNVNIAPFASRYAEAFYSTAVEKKKLKDISADFDKLSTFISESEDFATITANPRSTSENTDKLIAVLVKELKLNKLTGDMLRVVASHNRIGQLDHVVAAFKAKELEMSGEIEVDVITAKKCNKTLLGKITKAIETAKGSKLRVTETIDPNIYGGLIVKIDNVMIDMSLRSKLNKLSKTIRGS